MKCFVKVVILEAVKKCSFTILPFRRYRLRFLEKQIRHFSRSNKLCPLLVSRNPYITVDEGLKCLVHITRNICASLKVATLTLSGTWHCMADKHINS